MDTFRFTFFVSVTFYNSKTMKSKKKFQFWTIAENDSMSLNCIQDFPRSGATILTFLEYLITWFSLIQSNQFSICRLAINLTNLQAPSWSPPTLVILLAKKGGCCIFKLLILPPFFQGNDDQKLKCIKVSKQFWMKLTYICISGTKLPLLFILRVSTGKNLFKKYGNKKLHRIPK